MAGASEVGEGGMVEGGSKGVGGKDTDEATILPGGFSLRACSSGAAAAAANVTPTHHPFRIMQTGRQGGKREQGAEGKKRRVRRCPSSFGKNAARARQVELVRRSE